MEKTDLCSIRYWVLRQLTDFYLKTASPVIDEVGVEEIAADRLLSDFRLIVSGGGTTLATECLCPHHRGYTGFRGNELKSIVASESERWDTFEHLCGPDREDVLFLLGSGYRWNTGSWVLYNEVHDYELGIYPRTRASRVSSEGMGGFYGYCTICTDERGIMRRISGRKAEPLHQRLCGMAHAALVSEKEAGE